MLYKCEECGEVFTEDEIVFWEEDRGEFWGQSCSQTFCGCPNCYGYFEEYNEDEENEEE